MKWVLLVRLLVVLAIAYGVNQVLTYVNHIIQTTTTTHIGGIQ
jgi:hypothetical protein